MALPLVHLLPSELWLDTNPGLPDEGAPMKKKAKAGKKPALKSNLAAKTAVVVGHIAVTLQGVRDNLATTRDEVATLSTTVNLTADAFKAQAELQASYENATLKAFENATLDVERLLKAIQRLNERSIIESTLRILDSRITRSEARLLQGEQFHEKLKSVFNNEE
jgi:hypothetical protein